MRQPSGGRRNGRVDADNEGTIRGFPAMVGDNARVLVLGSMPGMASLRADQYYAHPRNAFWWIMGELFNAGPSLPYEKRLCRLALSGVALWDVLARCERRGSLDSDIRSGSERANDIATVLRQHATIAAVFLNGAKADQAFRRHCRTRVLAVRPKLAVHRMPSTSAAHASLGIVRKLQEWQLLLDYLTPNGAQ